ncbi:MAG TPA: DNA alkylation repair protein [Ignavibacteria bacterium]|nr:DNA alkylation repair protein [Ignavibacteria bacterium]HMQ97578.1 DNA alkylation repair protein [Ignavibacteria bacterium]
MAEPLKNMYNKPYLEKFAGVFKEIHPGFDTKRFMKLVFDNEWGNRELKGRMSHIARQLNEVLPGDYKRNVSILKKAVPHFKGFLSMIFPDYVEQFGLEDPKTSVPALELFTQYGSSEFAVRPFIIKYPEILIPEIMKWAKHKNHHVRRLASEGSRPRLPWAIALPEFKRDPRPVLKVLELLKNDESEYVRKSVANNLNDISKDNPALAFETAKKWYGKSKNTDWIVKHAMRGLLKKGNTDALRLFGWHGSEGIETTNLKLNSTKVQPGGKLEFSFSIEPVKPVNENVRLEYTIDFITSSGKISRKIFKITEGKFEKGKIYKFSKMHSFKDLTIRKHFKGQHLIGIIVNGERTAEKKFYVV